MSLNKTHEGANQYEYTFNHALEFFSKAASLRDNNKRKDFYGNGGSALDLFKAAWYAGDYVLCMKLLFQCRDARYGGGNRSGGRSIIVWLAENAPAWIDANISMIPEVGRWDDLRILFNTKCHKSAVSYWATAIEKGDSLACKWADRKDIPLYLELRNRRKVRNLGVFRRLLAEGRKNIVERKMCAKEWNEITYPHVPSVAMSRYTNAFKKHDGARFAEFKEKVQKGEVKINASALFPYDCVRTVNNGDKETADLQFNALPNYLEGTNQRIMVLCDSSGSMDSDVGGTTAFNVAASLALYCSDRVGKDNPFYRKFLQFESETHYTDWSDKKFSDCFKHHGYKVGIFNGACGATYINKSLNFILNSAKMYGATNEQIPNVLLIVSDMQFHSSTNNEDTTEVNSCIKKWEVAGYSAPKIVYWNVAGYAGSPATINCNNVGLVSGFSPSVLKAVFSGEDFTPYGIMMRAVSKYNINIPKQYDTTYYNT